jgi:hypothetical protein
MNLGAIPEGIALADTVTRLGARHADAVLVTGSHGGLIAADYAARAHVRAAIFNDAGVGLDEAGIAGMHALASIGMASAAVSHASARIADARDTWSRGVVAHANEIAAPLGVRAGMPCADAARLLLRAPRPYGALPPIAEARVVLVEATADSPAVLGLDSIGSVVSDDANAILVIGSHGALHGGDPASALPVYACAAFFHDAGRGKDDAGVSRLPVLDMRGIPAATIDASTARIGDARSMWATGRLSCVNRAMWRLGVLPPMSVQDAVERVLQVRCQTPNVTSGRANP